LKQLANYLVFGNVLIALGAASLFWLTCALNNFAIEFDFAVSFVFSATLVTYILQRYLQLDYTNSNGFNQRTTWISHNIQTVIFIGGVALVAAFFCFILSGMEFNKWLLLPAIVIVLYPLPILLGKKPRDFIILKSLIISGIWAFATVTIPFMAYETHPFEEVMWTQFLERFIFILIIKLPFDLKNWYQRTSTNVGEVKSLVGKYFAMILGGILIILYAIGYYLNHQLEGNILQIIAPLVIVLGLITFLLIIKGSFKSDWHQGFYLDGVLILHFALVFAFMQL